MARGRGACPAQVLDALERFGAPGPLARPVGSRRDDGEERVAMGRVRPFAAPGNASENGVNAHRAENGIGESGLRLDPRLGLFQPSGR